MIRTRSKELLLTTGATLAIAIAFCAMATAAQAKSWTVEGTPKSAGSFAHVGVENFTLSVEKRDLEIKCTPSGSGSATGTSTLIDEVSLTSCIAYHWHSSKTLPCTVAKPVPFEFFGKNAESVSNERLTKVELTGAECALPKENQLNSVVMKFSYGPEARQLAVSGTGSGTFGTFPMVITATYAWELTNATNKEKVWGYGEPHGFFIGGAFYEGGATSFEKVGTMTIEVPANQKVITCSESGAGTIGANQAVQASTHLYNCALKGFEKQCKIEPTEYAVTGGGQSVHGVEEKFPLKASGGECPLPALEYYLIPTFTLAYGSEAVSLPVTTSGTTTSGVYAMYYKGSATWKLTAAEHVGQTLGYH